jgi:glycosyltransferase involved in cell wall biosynthesis
VNVNGMPDMKKLSVIVPLYNEEECVTPLYESIVRAIDPLGMNYEILFVDDGSKDGTFRRAREIAEKDDRLRVIKFKKNCGQTPAMAAGFDHAQGEILVTMDGDLQNDPADIPEFLKAIEDGYDIVCGWRHKRQDRMISRKIPSVIANWIIGKITGVPIKDNGCSLKAYRSDIIKSIPLYSDMHRFIPAMTSLAGTRITELKVRHHPRRFGVSKYGISRIYKVVIDLIVIKLILSSVMKPLRRFAGVSLLSFAAGSILLFGVAGRVASGDGFDFIFASASLLFYILSFFLMMAGFASELVLHWGSFRGLAHLKARIE